MTLADIISSQDIQNKVFDMFTKAGYSQEHITRILNSASQLVSLKTMLELMQSNPPKDKLSSEDEMIVYIQKNFSQEKILEVLESNINKVAQQYSANYQ